MKKIFFLYFFIIASFTQAQVTRNPEIDRPSDQNADIIRVELTDRYTVITMVYKEEGNRQAVRTPFGTRYVMQPHSISIDPESFLRVGNKRYRFIRAEGIPTLPDETSIEIDTRLTFKVIYDRIVKGEEVFDFIEGRNVPNSTRNYWNFLGVHINNPLSNEDKPLQTPTPTPPLAVKPAQIAITGILFDETTRKPIVGNVTYEVEKSEIKVTQSTATNTSGEYSFNLTPKSYIFTAKAEGYEIQQSNLDFSKLTGNQQFTQNFYLKKTQQNKVEEPKKEETVLLPRETPKEESSPVKVEENKFRLDKVYFNVGESKLLPESHEQLNGLLGMMKENPKMKILIEGHTDNVGDAAKNKQLSLERAYNVRDYLVKKGIAGTRIQFKGYGDTKPVATNDTEVGRQTNRRVEFVIVEK